MTWEDDRWFAERVASLSVCNPFLEERLQLERAVLGDDYESAGRVWHAEGVEPPANVAKLQSILEEKVPAWLDELLEMRSVSERELKLYRDVAWYALYNRWQAELQRLTIDGDPTRRVDFWPAFERSYDALLPSEIRPEGSIPPDLLLAFFFQVRRAFHFIFRSLFGSSLPVATLRAEIWNSVFTRDMRRYRRGLYERLGDFTTLITGPSGTGKELVARAIGLSRFIPFDRGRAIFLVNHRESFIPVNLSALSPGLVESELFGHRKGSFTGALQDREGWLESCPPLGAVFLDEIGDVSPELQVKLLRVLQERTFERIGETRSRAFEGKLIAATNRDPRSELEEGRMRSDFYYRICSDLIHTPSLASQLADAPEDLSRLVGVVVNDLVGDAEPETITEEVCDWIEHRLGVDYTWPGNFRELEQCVRNIVLRGSYLPAGEAGEPASELSRAIEDLELDAETLLSRYVTLAYHRLGSYVGTAKKLGLDRRTVKAKIDEDLLAALKR